MEPNVNITERIVLENLSSLETDKIISITSYLLKNDIDFQYNKENDELTFYSENINISKNISLIIKEQNK